MLVFVIPLKSAQVSKSWNHVSKLFERCIRSVCNQTSNNYRVVVVCHEKPQIEFTHPHITYLEVEFPIPSLDLRSKYTDKHRKMLVGLRYAQRFEPSHTMNVDADDCVSKHIAEFAEQNPQSNGWFVNKGYVYQDGSKFIYFKGKDFYQWCGTSNIFRYDLHLLPESLSYDCIDANDYTSQHLSEEFIDFYRCFVNHRVVVQHRAQKGIPVGPLPFAGAVYILDHGENAASNNFNYLLESKNPLVKLKRMLSFRPLTSSVSNEFTIYNVH